MYIYKYLARCFSNPSAVNLGGARGTTRSSLLLFVMVITGTCIAYAASHDGLLAIFLTSNNTPTRGDVGIKAALSINASSFSLSPSHKGQSSLL
jgi:hypothetical protein